MPVTQSIDEAISLDAITTPLPGMADAILRELAELLAAFVATGEEASIDLRGGLPMSDADRERLAERLGHGEVSAIVSVAGESEVWETAVSGVWWVRHRGGDGRIAAESVVVTRLPEILATHPDDARDGLARLEAMLADVPPDAMAQPDANQPEDRA